MLSNMNSCPQCHAVFKTPPKLLMHVAAHILYNSVSNREDEPCVSCLTPSPSCQIALRKSKDTFTINYVNLMCPRLTKFSYAAASHLTSSNPSANVPVKCPHCPKGANTVWKYNMSTHYTKKHLPLQPPSEFCISDFKLEGLRIASNTRHVTNQVETRRRRHVKSKWDISEGALDDC